MHFFHLFFAVEDFGAEGGLFEAVGCPGEFVKGIVEVVAYIGARAPPWFVIGWEVCVVGFRFFRLRKWGDGRGGGEKYIPASRSISVMGLSEGGYIGFASTSIVEV